MNTTTSIIGIGLYFNNISKISYTVPYNIFIHNNKEFYVYDSVEIKNFNINVLGNFEYIDLILLIRTNANPIEFEFKAEFEKVFLYKHDFDLIDKIEIVDNSINTLLTSDYDASFNNVNISNDLNVTKNVNIQQTLFVENDVSFNSKLFVDSDVSFNSKLFVDSDVSFNSKLCQMYHLIVNYLLQMYHLIANYLYFIKWYC